MLTGSANMYTLISIIHTIRSNMISDNPYPKDTIEHHKWKLERQGFNQAQIEAILSMEKEANVGPLQNSQQNNENLLLTV